MSQPLEHNAMTFEYDGLALEQTRKDFTPSYFKPVPWCSVANVVLRV